MTSETAKRILQNHIDEQIHLNGGFTLPSYDKIVLTTMGFDEEQTMTDYTWRHLIRVAYM